MGREPGRFDHVHDDVLCVVSCVVWIIQLSPTHAVLERSTMPETESYVTLFTVTALDAAQDKRKES